MNDRQFAEDIQKLKSVDDEIQEVRFEGSEEWSSSGVFAAECKMISDLYAIVHDTFERWSAIIPSSHISSDIPLRTPDVIKKELKHAKNPMEIKRLNKELTDYYKDHKIHKGGSK